MPFTQPTYFKQQGMATLLVTAILAMIMGLMAMTTAQTGLMEQRITGNDLRAREAQEAAEAGLEYGVAWGKKNPIPNSVTCASGSLSTGCPSALTTVAGSSTGESYGYTLTYTKGTDAIKVTSLQEEWRTIRSPQFRKRGSNKFPSASSTPALPCLRLGSLPAVSPRRPQALRLLSFLT